MLKEADGEATQLPHSPGETSSTVSTGPELQLPADGRVMTHWASRSPTPRLHSNPCLIPGSALRNKTTIGLVIGPQTGFHGLPEAGGRLSGGESSPTRAVSAMVWFQIVHLHLLCIFLNIHKGCWASHQKLAARCDLKHKAPSTP